MSEHNQTDRVRSLEVQHSRGRIRLIVQLAHRMDDAFAELIGHKPCSVDDMRNRARGYTGALSHVADRHHRRNKTPIEAVAQPNRWAAS